MTLTGRGAVLMIAAGMTVAVGAIPPSPAGAFPSRVGFARGLAAPDDAPSITVVPDHGSAAESITLSIHFPYASDRPGGVCPGAGNPPAVIAWDGVRLQTLAMNGRCDLAATVTPPAGHAEPGVHRITATEVPTGSTELTAIGLYTVDAGRTPAPIIRPKRHLTAYLAGIAAVLAAIAVAVAMRRRRSS